MPSVPKSGRESAYSDAGRQGEPAGLPAHLLGLADRQHLERIGEGRDSGVSAAIWTRREQGPAETRSDGFSDMHMVTVRLEDQKIERWIDGQPIRDEVSRRGASYLVRAGTAPRWVCYGSYRTFTFFLPTSLVERNASEIGFESSVLERLGSAISYDVGINQLAASAMQEIAAGAGGSRLHLDAIGTSLCVHLLRRAAGTWAYQPQARGGLAGWQLKRIEACIAARFNENLSLASLAAEIGLSPYHFARAFKESTGQSPHQYLLHCRLARAKELLAATDASIGEIAARVGYDDPAQLSRLFRIALGTTPHAYRRVVRL